MSSISDRPTTMTPSHIISRIFLLSKVSRFYFPGQTVQLRLYVDQRLAMSVVWRQEYVSGWQSCDAGCYPSYYLDTNYPAQSGSASEERHDEPSSSRPVRQTYLH